MAHPESIPSPEPPQNPEDDPLSDQDLIDLAANMTAGKSTDFFASFTSFINVGISHDTALKMLGIDAEQARQKLQSIRDCQAESLRHNVDAIRGFGGTVITAASYLNPLRYLKKK